MKFWCHHKVFTLNVWMSDIPACSVQRVEQKTHGQAFNFSAAQFTSLCHADLTHTSSVHAVAFLISRLLYYSLDLIRCLFCRHVVHKWPILIESLSLLCEIKAEIKAEMQECRAYARALQCHKAGDWWGSVLRWSYYSHGACRCEYVCRSLD